MDADESSPSGLCARLYHVILDAFRRAISHTRDAQLLSKLQSCGQRFKLWAAGLHVESGDLDAQLDEDADMKDSVLLLLGLILYDLYRTYKHIRQSDLGSNHGDTIDARGSSPLSARSLQDSNNLYDTILEHSEETSNAPRDFGPNNASVALSLRLTDDPQIEDHAHWISSLTYICPSLESFVTDSDLEGTNGPGPSDIDSEELVKELVEDIVDTVQQLYDLGPSLAWEITLPKTEGDSENERHMEVEDSLEEDVMHYLFLTGEKFSNISYRLALRLAKANWARDQRLETARATASAERAALASRTIREKSHADSGYYTGSKPSTVQAQDDSAQSTDDLDHIGTEYDSVYSSTDRFGAHGRLRFPVPPVEQLGLDRGKFDCTVCGSTVGPFRDKREWRLHVVRDLAPYICPIPECKSDRFVFESQRSFTAHLRSCHGPSFSWRCKFPHCDTSFSELKSFQDHLWLLHGISEGEDSEHLCNAWKESARLVREEISCPICNGAMNASPVQQSKHLGHHMIEIALLSIPNHILDPDESEESDTSELSVDHLESETDNKGEANTAGSAQKSTSDQHETIIGEEANVKAGKEAKDGTDRSTPLHRAASNGYTDIAKLLIEAGADKEAKDRYSRTPLHWAASNGYTDIAKRLVEAGADKEAKDGTGSTPLYRAAFNGHRDIAKLLIEAGADKEAKNRTGSTPLHLATSKGHIDTAKLLIEVGADKEAKDNIGRTPLYRAISNGYTDIAKLLVEAGADKEAKNGTGLTPLHWAASYGYTDIAKLLIEAGADKEAKDRYSRTPLHRAASNGYIDIARLLIEAGADKEAKDNISSTPLH